MEPGSRAGRDAHTCRSTATVGANGDIFVSDGHAPNKHNSARIVKFAKDGGFIKAWGHKGAAPGDFDEPHDIFIGGSQNRVYVADRKNNRIQVFDQDGNFIAAWTSSVSRARYSSARTMSLFPGPGRQEQAGRDPRHRDRQRQGRIAQGLYSGPLGPQ